MRIERFVFFEYVPDPGFVELGVFAIAGMQRNRIRRNAGEQHFVDRFFQHVQTGDTENTVDVAADDNLQNDGRTFCDQHLITELLGFDFVVGDGTGTTGFAVEAELVVVGGATFGVLQAMR